MSTAPEVRDRRRRARRRGDDRPGRVLVRRRARVRPRVRRLAVRRRRRHGRVRRPRPVVPAAAAAAARCWPACCSPPSPSPGRSPGWPTRRRSPRCSRRSTTWNVAWADLGAGPRPVPGRRRAGRVRRRLGAPGDDRDRLRRARRRTRSPSAPTPAARRSFPAPCCSSSSPRSAPTATGSSLTLALVAAGFLAAALLRVRFAQAPRTVLGRPAARLSITLPAAALAGTAVVLGAWVVGPRLPGAHAEPLVETRNDARRGHRGPQPARRHPLPSRQPGRHRAVRRDRRTTPSYWRVSGLPEFDGRTWGLPDRSLDDVAGPLSAPRRARPRTTRRSSSARWRASSCRARPSPWRRRARGCAGTPRRRRSCGSTADLDDGDRFEVVSAMPSFTEEALRAATSDAPPDPDLPRAARRLPVVGRASSRRR